MYNITFLFQNTAAMKAFMELYGDVSNVSGLWNGMKYSFNIFCRINGISVLSGDGKIKEHLRKRAFNVTEASRQYLLSWDNFNSHRR